MAAKRIEGVGECNRSRHVNTISCVYPNNMMNGCLNAIKRLSIRNEQIGYNSMRKEDESSIQYVTRDENRPQLNGAIEGNGNGMDQTNEIPLDTDASSSIKTNQLDRVNLNLDGNNGQQCNIVQQSMSLLRKSLANHCHQCCSMCIQLWISICLLNISFNQRKRSLQLSLLSCFVSIIQLVHFVCRMKASLNLNSINAFCHANRNQNKRKHSGQLKHSIATSVGCIRMSLFVVLVVCVATLGTVGQASITVTAAAAAAAATVPERQMSLLNIDSIATSSMTAAATTTDLGEETIMDEEESNGGKGLPKCSDDKSVCAYMQINALGVSRVPICECKGPVQCPTIWSQTNIVQHGNDFYLYCKRKPRLATCKPNQIAYSSFGKADLLSGRKVVDMQRVHCICPNGHILKSNRTMFEMLDTTYIFGTEQLCKTPATCTRKQLCLSITETAESTLEKRHCRCPFGKVCPRNVRQAYERIEEDKGTIYNMRCL